MFVSTYDWEEGQLYGLEHHDGSKRNEEIEVRCVKEGILWNSWR
jgi:hypothetical protein